MRNLAHAFVGNIHDLLVSLSCLRERNLNPPQVAILGVGAIQVKPVRRNGSVEFIDAIGLSLTCDHQVIDGAPGARFLNVLRDRIETVESLCPL